MSTWIMTRKMAMEQMIFLLVLFSLHSTSFSSFSEYDYGGHSSEFKPMGYEWKMADLEFTRARRHEIHALSSFPRASLSSDEMADRVSFDAEFTKFYRALPGVLKSFEEDLERVLRENEIVGVVTGRIKSLSSLRAKMKEDGITDYRKITDIVGLRVTLQSTNEILKFKEAYLKSFNESVNEMRCYGVCGPSAGNLDPRAKWYWPWKGSGYRRLHFKVAIPKLKTAGEIQVGTPYMTIWADWGHEVVYKGPEELKRDSGVNEYAQRLAKYYMMLDDLRNGMSPECPRILKDAESRPIYGHDWAKFGSPPNLCNFWNDLRTNM